MNEIFQRAFSTALLVAMALLVAYQIFMLWWTKLTAGKLPKAIIVLRGINIAMLVVGTIVIIAYMVGR